MANMSTMSTPQPVKGQNKSNVWLIIIIILVAGAILWPILRQETPAETEPSEDIATTTVSFDEAIDDETGSAVVNPSPANQSASVGVAGVETMILRVYFGNRNLDPQGLKCDMVYPIFRTVPRTTAVGRAALSELLRGPTPAEAAGGVVTSINPGVKLQSLTIENGLARADFSQELGLEVGGACLTSAIRAQITDTLKQFPTVRSVIISINGVSEGILQS